MPVAVTWDHLHLRSPDPEKTAAFYVEMFGATITERVPTPSGVRIIVDLAGRNLFVEEVPAGTATPPEPPFLGLEHIGLGVTDIDAAAAELKRKGVRFTMEPNTTRPGLRIAFLRGPEDVSIELLQRS